MAAPLLLYLFNEASSGNTPTVVHDTSAGAAADATITYGASAAWTSIVAGDGFNHSVGGSALTASLGGTKVQTAMAGGKTATIQMVIDANGGGGNIFVMYASNLDEIISLAFDSGNAEMDVTLANSAGDYGVGRFTLPTTGVFVITILIDTTQTGTAVVQGYMGTTLLTTRTFTAIPVGTALDAGESWTLGNGIRLSIGNNPATSQATTKTYFAALYSSVLGTTQINANATALAANNDADPNAGGAVNPPFDQQPTVRMMQRFPWRPAETYPQLGVKTGTGLPDVQGRATPLMRRFPSPDFEALPPRVVVGAPPPVDSPTTARRIYLAMAPRQTEVPPQLGVATGTGLPDVQGAAVVPLRRFPGAPIDPLPPLAAAAAVPPPVDSPVVRLLPPLRPRPQSTEAYPQLGVKTGTGLPDVQGLVARAIRRIVQPLNDPAPPLPVKASPILDIQPVRRFMRLVRTVFTDLGSWLALPILARLRPPFVAVVDSSATTVVPGAQQLTAVVDAQSLTVDGDT